MTEPTLTLTWDDLLDEVTEYVFGGDGDYDNLTVEEKARAVRILNQGLRQFYSPPAIGGHVHSWTFLAPTATLSLNAPYSTGTAVYDHADGGHGDGDYLITITGGAWPSWFTGDAVTSSSFEINNVSYRVAAYVDTDKLTLSSVDNPGSDISTAVSFKLHQDDYVLPDDFGYIIGNITYTQGDQALRDCIIVDEQRILSLRQRPFTNAIGANEPWQAAIRAKTRAETEGTVQEIIFWPSVSSAATAYIKYRRRPDQFTEANRSSGYPYGASDHSEVILQSCLAAAEQRMDEMQGPHFNRFMQLLEAAIEQDGRTARPQFLGPNRDSSDEITHIGDLRSALYGDLYGNPVRYVGTGSQ